MLSYLLFPPLASSNGTQGECSAFCELSHTLQMRTGEELPEDRPDHVPIVMVPGKKLAASQFLLQWGLLCLGPRLHQSSDRPLVSW